MRGLAMAVTALAVSIGPGRAAEPTGDREHGERVWALCETCHAIGPGAENGIGPHLNELFGRAAASVEGFDYSEDMRRAGADGMVWTTEKLNLYLENPRQLVTGTRMVFPGLPDESERHDLLAFLREHSASPRDIPESEPTAFGRDPDLDPTILAIAGDRDYGAYLASECVTCHRADGASEGIPSIVGWPKHVFVIVMHAYKTEARPHPVMQLIAGRLSDEEIASLAVHFEEIEQ